MRRAVGLLFANYEMHLGRPDAESDVEKSAGFALAIGLHYAHGRVMAPSLSVAAPVLRRLHIRERNSQ